MPSAVFSISTTPSSTTAVPSTRAGAMRAPVMPHRLAPLDAAVVVDAIRKTSKWYWDDPDRHREGRLRLDAARREVVRLALRELGVEDAGACRRHRRRLQPPQGPRHGAAAGCDRDRAMASRVGPAPRTADQRRRGRPSEERLRASRLPICSTPFLSKASWDSESPTSASTGAR